MLLCERGKVLHFLRVVDVHLGHRRIQDGLASRSDFFVRLYIVDEESDHHSQKNKKVKSIEGDVPLVLPSLLYTAIMRFDGYL